MSGGEERLFVVMLGGRHPRGRTELHDVVFAFGRTLAVGLPVQLHRA